MENLSETYKIIITLLSTGLLLIPLIIILKKYELKRQKQLIEKNSISMHNMYQNLIVTDFELFPIDSDKFTTLDLNFYNSVSLNLIQKQFCIIGDFEESNFKKRNPSISYFIRLMLSGDGIIKATIYHLKIGGASFKTVELITEFAEGPVLITSNNILNAKIKYPDEIEFTYYNTESSTDLLNHHTNRIHHIQTIKSFGIQRINDVDEIIEQNRRIKLKENQYRQFINKADIIKELRRICFGIRNEDTFSKIADRIIELRALNSQPLKEIKNVGNNIK